MPESKKISELPAFSTVQSGDILPIVDASLTQTGKCTAAQIAQLGGGAPGLDTVSNKHVVDSGLQARKLGFTNSDRIAYSTTNTDTVEGATRYRCTETAITQYARDLLSKPDAASAWTHLSANPTFSGPVQVPAGSASAPTYSFVGSPTTGLFNTDESVGITCNGELLFLFSQARNVYSLPPGGTQLCPAIPVRSYALFSPSGIGAAQTTLTLARDIGSLLGYTTFRYNSTDNGPNLWNNTSTNTYMATALTAALAARGLAYVSHSTTDRNGKNNYTSPGDNYLISLDANGAFLGYVGASQKTWVGQLTYSTLSGATTVFRSENVSSVTPNPQLDANGNRVTSGGTTYAGAYLLQFWTPMPDTNYLVLGSGTGTTYPVARTIAKWATGCVVQFSPAPTSECFVAVVR